MADTDLVESLTSRRSGSAGSTTYGRNQFGQWTRPRVDPTDPGTSLQDAVRGAMTTLAVRWASTLTTPERRAWDLYALNVFRPGPLGRQTHTGGLPMYIRSNLPRLHADTPKLPVIDTAPELFDLGTFKLIGPFIYNKNENTLHVFYDQADEWVGTDGAALLVYASAPQPTTVNFFKGPYRFAGSVLGNLPRPQSPFTLDMPFPTEEGNDRVFVRARVTQADARLSPSFRHTADLSDQAGPVPVFSLFLGGPPDFTLTTFDQQLAVNPHDGALWTMHHDVQFYVGNAATTQGFDIRTRYTPTITGSGPNVVTYSPTNGDVKGLLNGTPASLFADFPLAG